MHRLRAGAAVVEWRKRVFALARSSSIVLHFRLTETRMKGEKHAWGFSDKIEQKILINGRGARGRSHRLYSEKF